MYFTEKNTTETNFKNNYVVISVIFDYILIQL